MNKEDQESSYTFSLTLKEVEALFKYLSRTELKGVEVPEFNNILNIFKIKKDD
jgi:hypothetical protein